MQAAVALNLARRLGLPAWVRDAGLVVAGSLVVAALAQVSFPLPFTPVPLTGQTLGVLLVGAALGSRRGAASLALYVAEGALGLPVFAPHGAPGPARLLGPTAGYLLGFVAAAWVVGRLAERGYGRRLHLALAATAAGQAAIFACGLAGLAPFVGTANVLPAGLWPFVPGAAIKTLLAALALHGAGRIADGPAAPVTRRRALVGLVLLAGLALHPPAAAQETRPAPAEDLLAALPGARATLPGLLTGGQPTREQLEAAARAGLRTVINLRTEGEAGFEWERAVVEAAGLRYVHVPIAGPASFDRRTVEQLDEVLRGADRPALLHCASGNRVGAVLALREGWLGGADPQAALELGTRAGLAQPLLPAVRTALGLPGGGNPPR